MTLLGGYLLYRLAKQSSAGEEPTAPNPPQDPAEEKAFPKPEAPTLRHQEEKPIGSL